MKDWTHHHYWVSILRGICSVADFLNTLHEGFELSDKINFLNEMVQESKYFLRTNPSRNSFHYRIYQKGSIESSWRQTALALQPWKPCIWLLFEILACTQTAQTQKRFSRCLRGVSHWFLYIEAGFKHCAEEVRIKIKWWRSDWKWKELLLCSSVSLVCRY